MVINISITNKRPTVISTPVIACGNSDYSITFTFDSEWDGLTEKTARFIYVQRGALHFQDVSFSGDTVAVPILSATREVMVGVYAGELRTSTPARIPCEYSILCPDAEEQIGAMDAVKLQDQIGDLSQLKTTDSSSLVAAINWLYENGTGGGVSASGMFVPHISADGTLSWTNDQGLPNPDPVNLRGPQGPKGADGTMSFEDLTDEQRESLRGPQGDKGDKGDSGVWVGSEAPPDGDYSVWVDPDGSSSGGNVDRTIETVLSLKEVQVGSHKSGAFDSADNKSICTNGYVKPFVVSAKVVSADYHLAVVVYDNGAYVRTDSWITVDNTYTFDHENYQYKLYIKRPDNDYIWNFDECRKSIILTISTADILESYNALEVKSDTERRNTRNAVEYMMRRNYDISYANAPAPLDLITYAGNNQIVHPKVLYFPNKFGRHKFWLAYNPYPLANAYYENPCVAYSDDGYEWTNIPGNPLDDPGEYGINTDVHLVYVETKNRLEIWWRYADNKDDTVEVRREIIYRRTSTDGLNWTERETVFVNDSGDTVQNLSPCILHDGSKYKIWVVNDTESTVKYYEGMEERNATADETIALNDADLNPGIYLVNGNIQENASYMYTDQIKLSASKTFSLTGKNSNGVPYHVPIRYIVAFDADGNRLTEYSRSTNTEGGTISSMPTRPIVMNEAVDSVVLTLYKPEQYTEKVITLAGVDGGTSELSFVRDIPLTFPDDGTGHRLWHIDVIEDNGKTVMLPMCRARDSFVAIEQTWSLFLCTSEDNVTYTEPVQTIVGNPYGWDKQIYRSSIVNVDGEYRIYYTAQDERQRHGLGVSTSNTLSNFVGKW